MAATVLLVEDERKPQDLVRSYLERGRVHRAVDRFWRGGDRFWRGRQAAHISGSGIGLAVAAELTRAHGGQLSANSPPGQGTCMTLTLPRA
jgi:signal transduction histidine kinase